MKKYQLLKDFVSLTLVSHIFRKGYIFEATLFSSWFSRDSVGFCNEESGICIDDENFFKNNPDYFKLVK